MGIDRLIVIACVFAGGFLIGQINAPEAKILHCLQKPSAPVMYESRGDVKYWRDYTKGLPK
jgi:hypothetical protein